MGLLSGVLIDYLGVKWALTLGALVSAGGRLLFCVATAPWVAILAAVVVMPLGASALLSGLLLSAHACARSKSDVVCWVCLCGCMLHVRLCGRHPPCACAGMAFGIPVLVISIKRSTTPANRPFAFSLFCECGRESLCVYVTRTCCVVGGYN